MTKHLGTEQQIMRLAPRCQNAEAEMSFSRRNILRNVLAGAGAVALGAFRQVFCASTDSRKSVAKGGPAGSFHWRTLPDGNDACFREMPARVVEWRNAEGKLLAVVGPEGMIMSPRHLRDFDTGFDETGCRIYEPWE